MWAVAGLVWRSPWFRLALVTVAIGLGVRWALHRYHEVQQQRTLAELRLHEQLVLNDSATARLAHAHVVADSLTGVVAAAKALNGKLVAALAVEIAKRDTVLVHDTLPTDRLPDSTRTATFRDSTFAGTVTGTVTAPPYPAALGVTYHITRPAFRPEFGLVAVGDSVVGVVVWQGERLRVAVPYAAPRPPREPWIGLFVEADYVLWGDRAPEGQLGAFLRPFRGWELQLGAVQEVDWRADRPFTRQGLRLGVRHTF